MKKCFGNNCSIKWGNERRNTRWWLRDFLYLLDVPETPCPAPVSVSVALLHLLPPPSPSPSCFPVIWWQMQLITPDYPLLFSYLTVYFTSISCSSIWKYSFYSRFLTEFNTIIPEVLIASSISLFMFSGVDNELNWARERNEMYHN